MVKTPLDMSKSKNMELGKLLFMGLVPAEERRTLVDEIIHILKKELTDLHGIQAAILQAEKDQMITYFKNDTEYLSGIQKATGITDVADNVNVIDEFQEITLQYVVRKVM